MRSLGCLLLVCSVLLAGCAETPDPGASADPGQDDDAQGSHQMVDLLTGDPSLAGVVASETFTGHFDFQDNSQYMGEVADETGQDWTNTRQHDVSGLLSSGAPYEISVVADAETGAGDIDVWFEHDGLIAAQWCDCPFGGHNELRAYSTGDAGSMTLVIQFDEIHDEPTDTGPPAEGFDYNIDVEVRSDPRMVPPGVPLAYELAEAGDHIMFENATETIVVFDPDDQPVARLEPSDHIMFTLDANQTTGEYVFVQAFSGAPATARGGTAGIEPPESDTRFLDLDFEVESVDVSGGSGELSYEVPAHVLETGACGFAGDAEVDPAFELLQPDGTLWDESTSTGPALLGWGACRGLDLSSGEIQSGTWTATYTGTVGEDGELFRWVTWYER